MWSGLVRNTAVSAVAYAAVAVVNLLLVPVLVGAYGLNAYGLLVMSRVFLPSGFAIADFGLSETATLIVARARAASDWDGAGRRLAWLFALSLTIAIVLGSLMLAFGSLLATWLHVGSEFVEGFVLLIRITAVSLVVFYPALMLEGMVKGYERYTLLRSLEVAMTLSYALGSVMAIRAGYSYEAIAYLFLVTTAGKYVVLAACAVPMFRHLRFRFDRHDVEARTAVRERSALMVHNKILGTFQTQLPPVLIGLLIGPIGVGTYDVLTRVPRAVKSVLSLLTAALLPISARLDESGDHSRLRTLGNAGFSLIPIVTFPTLLGAAVFARELLHVWLGPELVHLWPWLSLMFLVPALNTLLSFGQTMMQVRSHFLALSNRIVTAQIAVQYAVAFALVPWFREQAFIAGQVVAAVVAFPWQLRLQLREQGLAIASVYQMLGKHAVMAAILASFVVVLKRTGSIDTAGPLLACYAVWCLTYVAGSYLLTLSQAQRVYVQRVLRAAMGSGTHS